MHVLEDGRVFFSVFALACRPCVDGGHAEERIHATNASHNRHRTETLTSRGCNTPLPSLKPPSPSVPRLKGLLVVGRTRRERPINPRPAAELEQAQR